MKVVLTAGGTGGHIYPAIGIIDKLKENNLENTAKYIVLTGGTSLS